MADDDFYFEESNPKKVFLTILLILFIIGVLFGIYKYIAKRDFIKLNNVEVELGSAVSTDIKDYIKSGKYEGYTLDVSNVHLDNEGLADSIGEYSFTVKKNNNILKGKIYVKDTTAPRVEVTELTVGLNEEFDINDFLISCEDLSEECFVTYASDKEKKYNQAEGTYDITLKIKDKYNNETTKTTKLIVKEGFSLADLKATNNDATNIYPVDDDWDETYTLKFSRGISEEDEEFEAKILELAKHDFSEYYEETIKNQTMITIYNKYNFVLGFSIKLEFEDGNIIYVPEDVKKNED
ncbi:MAG: hypothetical protein PHX04_00030 [Bacilli bacterium]|nr:hypothetical protein [Bacilli bacterium]